MYANSYVVSNQGVALLCGVYFSVRLWGISLLGLVKLKNSLTGWPVVVTIELKWFDLSASHISVDVCPANPSQEGL